MRRTILIAALLFTAVNAFAADSDRDILAMKAAKLWAVAPSLEADATGSRPSPRRRSLVRSTTSRATSPRSGEPRACPWAAAGDTAAASASRMARIGRPAWRRRPARQPADKTSIECIECKVSRI